MMYFRTQFQRAPDSRDFAIGAPGVGAGERDLQQPQRCEVISLGVQRRRNRGCFAVAFANESRGT
jgi:hypothetical protein